MLEEPTPLKGKPLVMSAKSSGLGAAGAAMAPTAKNAREMYETCILLIKWPGIWGINESIDGQRSK
jgi:hypothetical protein